MSRLQPFKLSALVLLLCVSCAKDADKSVDKANTEASEPEVDPTPVSGETPTPKSDEKTPEEKAASQKRVSDALAKLEVDTPKELERWTDELKASTAALIKKEFKTPAEALAAALASPHRMPGNAERDAHRHPQATLEFFALTPTSRVVEMGAGGGWYTELLAAVVANKGHLRVGTFDPNGAGDSMRTVYGQRQVAFLSKFDPLFGKVEKFRLGGKEPLLIAEPGSADLVLAIREMHNWQRRGTLEADLKAVAEVLAPGGSFGVVQHRANPDAKAEESAEQGYLPEAWLIAKVEAAGLKLADKSDINANPKDTKDYEKGVWTLPPNYRSGDADREKYAAIGESDRMTLRFEKPKAP
jgi:predicted methyltransferase